MMKRGAIRRTVMAAFVVMVAASCGDDATGPNACLTTFTLQINVFPEPAPRFEWVPSCLISELVVFDEVTQEEMWTLFSSGGDPNTIASGVVYGTVPEDAAEGAPEVPLVAGRTYRVTLSATGNGDVEVLGTRTFVR